MPCTWIGYGERLPRLPINTREKKKRRKNYFWRKEGSKLEKQKKKRKQKQMSGGKNKDYSLCTKKKKNRPHPLGTTVVFPSPPPPAHREQPPTEPGKERVEDWCWQEKKGKKNRIQGMKKIDNREKNNNLSLRPLSSLSGTTGRRTILLLGRHQWHCPRPPQRGKNID
jgi:hypothetical protein